MLDRTAPASPTGLTVGPPATGCTPTRWTNPDQGQAAPIAAARLSDGTVVKGANIQQLESASPVERVHLEDAAGNADPATAVGMSTSTPLQLKPPILQSTSAPKIKVSSAKRQGTRLVVKGTVTNASTTRVTVTVTRGKRSTRKTATLSKGRFTVRVALSSALRRKGTVTLDRAARHGQGDEAAALLGATRARDARELVGRDRAAEQEALAEAAAERAQGVGLLGLLDALGDQHQAQRLAHGHDRLQQRAVLARVAGEGAVDLQDVHREPAQVAQRRVAGAEVVDREPDAEPAQGLQALGLGVADQRGLGDLEDQPGGVEAAVAQRERDLVDEARLLELGAGDVDATGTARPPTASAWRARLAQDPAARAARSARSPRPAG